MESMSWAQIKFLRARIARAGKLSDGPAPTCGLCGRAVPGGLACGSGHYHCPECFRGFVRRACADGGELGAEGRLRSAWNGGRAVSPRGALPCPGFAECGHGALEEAEVL